MAAPTLAYTVRPYRPSDLDGVLGLLQRSLAGGPTGRRTGDFFTWKHARNPFGRSLALVAEEGGELIGFRTFMRWRFLLDGEPVTAVRAVDTATDPEHQGRGVFTRLTREAITQLRAEGVDLIFNTPNASSLPGYLKMGWSVVGKVPVALRPLRPVRFAWGVRHAGQGAPGGHPPPCPLPPARSVFDNERGVEALLAEVAPAHGRLVTDRSVGYLRWRYADAPDLDYRGLTISAGGKLMGVAFGRARRRGPLAEFTLSELLVRDGDRRTAARLLREAGRSGTDHVATHLASDPCLRAAGRRAGYLSVPGHGMTLVVRPLSSDLPIEPRRLASWRLSLGDLEVF